MWLVKYDFAFDCIIIPDNCGGILGVMASQGSRVQIPNSPGIFGLEKNCYVDENSKSKQ